MMYRRIFKPLWEYILVLIFLPFFVALLVLVSLISLAHFHGKILFIQPRIGYKGKPFNLIKFRTLPIRRNDKLGFSHDELTPYTRFLRKYSLDELPQVINFIKGDIALVGPRPIPVEYQDKLTDDQQKRHEVKPGITGWAQVNGRSNISWQKRFQLDLHYITRQSFLLDLRILILTITQTLTGKNSGEGSGEVLG